jgi:hypothetical protein
VYRGVKNYYDHSHKFLQSLRRLLVQTARTHGIVGMCTEPRSSTLIKKYYSPALQFQNTRMVKQTDVAAKERVIAVHLSGKVAST